MQSNEPGAFCGRQIWRREGVPNRRPNGFELRLRFLEAYVRFKTTRRFEQKDIRASQSPVSKGTAVRGMVISGRRSALIPVNPERVTPMIVKAAPSIFSTFPITLRSPA